MFLLLCEDIAEWMDGNHWKGKKEKPQNTFDEKNWGNLFVFL